jgi:lysophospholipase L1-like esterase
MEYSFHHFLNQWSQYKVELYKSGLEKFDEMAKGSAFKGINWNNIINSYNRNRGSLFSGFALYVDHVHPSPEGNRVLAEEIYQSLH